MFDPSTLAPIHDTCQSFVNWQSSYPEISVGVWALSGILTMLQMVNLSRRMLFRRPEPVHDVVEVINTVNVPYVPGETVLKLVKLMNEQEHGWKLDTDKQGYNTLTYGNLAISGSWSGLTVSHKGTAINLKRDSSAPHLDQQVLQRAFNQRVVAEKGKIQAHKQMLATNAEEFANREIKEILEQV